MGRVCYRPCETACNRAQLDAVVGINAVERFLGDEALRRGWSIAAPGEPSGKRVLVVGRALGPVRRLPPSPARPRGCDPRLRVGGRGHDRFGTPRTAFPARVLDGEIARILEMGVRLELNHTITDLLAEMREGGFDATFLAVGAHIGEARPTSRPAMRPGSSTRCRCCAAWSREKPMLGRRVAVYGGGNTAMDAARTARRLGATEAIVVYRRTGSGCRPTTSRSRRLSREGVTMKWLSTVKHAGAGKLLIERMELDGDGFPQPTGETRGAGCRLARSSRSARRPISPSSPPSPEWR